MVYCSLRCIYRLLWRKVRNIAIKNCSMWLEGVKAKYSVTKYIVAGCAGCHMCGFLLTTPSPPGGLGVLWVGWM